MYQKIYTGLITSLVIGCVNTVPITVLAQIDKIPSTQETTESYYAKGMKDYYSKDYKAAINN
jgi:hypothetical protein